MKINNIYKFYIILLTVLTIPNVSSATSYNYLPNDVYIKQQEEKSALEYRLRSIESGMTGIPELQINTINSRISQLEDERNTERNYVIGLYAKNGISNQSESALSKIDTKYNNLINDLRNQISYYQNQVKNKADIEAEKEKIRQQIKDIDAYYDKQRDDLTQKYQQNTEPVKQTNVTEVYYKYLETLSKEEWLLKMNQLKVSNPDSYQKIVEMYRLYYPEYFTENKTQQTDKVAPVTPSKKPSVKKTPVKEDEQFKFFDDKKTENNQVVNATTSTEIVKNIPPKQSVFKKIINFLSRIF